MEPIVSTIEIARPPDEVFRYATDPARFPEWQKDVVSVSMSGSRFVTTRRVGGVNRLFTQEGRTQELCQSRKAPRIGQPHRANLGLRDSQFEVTVAFLGGDHNAGGIDVPAFPRGGSPQRGDNQCGGIEDDGSRAHGGRGPHGCAVTKDEVPVPPSGLAGITKGARHSDFLPLREHRGPSRGSLRLGRSPE